jgi:hypothetical protein
VPKKDARDAVARFVLLGMRQSTEGYGKTTMIGETSKLTLIIPPKRERKALIPVQSPYNSWLAEPRMSLSQSQKFSDNPSYLESL